MRARWAAASIGGIACMDNECELDAREDVRGCYCAREALTRPRHDRSIRRRMGHSWHSRARVVVVVEEEPKHT